MRSGFRTRGECVCVGDKAPHIAAALSVVLPVAPEEYIKAHGEVYITLSEAISFDVIFSSAQSIQRPASHDYDWVNAALQILVAQFLRKRLTLGGFAKFSNQDETRSFKEILSRHSENVKKIL